MQVVHNVHARDFLSTPVTHVRHVHGRVVSTKIAMWNISCNFVFSFFLFFFWGGEGGSCCCNKRFEDHLYQYTLYQTSERKAKNKYFRLFLWEKQLLVYVTWERRQTYIQIKPFLRQFIYCKTPSIPHTVVCNYAMYNLLISSVSVLCQTLSSYEHCICPFGSQW